ncbi:G patch domain and ankyrin repeat-containing protein 1 [Salminus brasiliensis]|uniref:G patch domain and ankyrin repeat-containing protein 1 n=1 Tax=Salminus brasiliensis TaxID=930266 RepID=UPI003B83874C
MSGLGFFTQAKEEDRRWTDGEKTRKKERGGATLTGDEAKEFYQSLIGGEGGEGRKENKVERRRRGVRARAGGPHRRCSGGSAAPPAGQVEAVSERDGHWLLRCAQDGDLRALTELLDRGCDVNFRDGFFWTPLMCASHSGQREAVRLLLTRGAAWVGVVDIQGRDARSLALQAGHQDVVAELDQFSVTQNSHTPSESTHSPSPQWCAVCEVSYTDRADSHAASTLHQFSLKRPPAAPHYCLPESSVSYRMMLSSGWDPHRGLGPSHSGRKHPIGTVLKRDHGGLGFGRPQRSKVTHFGAKDPQAVRRTERKDRVQRRERGASLSVKEMKRREERERSWERNFRSSFNIDA